MSNNNRKTAYSKSDDPTSVRDERMSRLKFELREHIRFLSDYELLSPDWLRMAESLHQIANVAFMETHLPPSEDNPLTQQGKKAAGTLWDQERDELAIRILLEEGKLNLALRLLHKYRIAIRDNTKWESMLKLSSEKNKHELSLLNERCKVFEQSVGVLIRFSLAHIEAVQIIDMPEFIQHCVEIFNDALSTKSKWSAAGTDGEKMQETLIIYYLAAIANKIEELDEDRVMDLIEENQLLLIFLKHMNTNYTLYKIETLEAAGKFLNGIFSSEAYQTERDRFLPNNDNKNQLVNLKGFFISELITSYGLKRKDVQTLLDEFTKFEKIVGPTTNVPLKLKSAATAATASSSNTSSNEAEKKDNGKTEKK